MRKKDMINKSIAGEIIQELNEIKKMQQRMDSYWTISTNTCGELYTVFCC